MTTATIRLLGSLLVADREEIQRRVGELQYTVWWASDPLCKCFICQSH